MQRLTAAKAQSAIASALKLGMNRQDLCMIRSPRWYLAIRRGSGIQRTVPRVSVIEVVELRAAAAPMDARAAFRAHAEALSPGRLRSCRRAPRTSGRAG